MACRMHPATVALGIPMPTASTPARVVPLVCAAILLSGGLHLLVPVSEAGARYFEEDWELDSAGWTYSTDRPTARQDCTGLYAHRGLCSLEIEAQKAGEIASASRDLDLQFESPGYVVSFYFRNDWPYSYSKGWVTMQLGNGTHATVDLSYGSGNQVALRTERAHTGGLTPPSGKWWMYEEQTWYRILLKADLVGKTLLIEVRDAEDNALLATGPALPLPSGATIGMVSFEGSYSSTGALHKAPQKINYDFLTITGPDEPSAPRLLKALPGPGLGEVTVDWQAPLDDGGASVLHYNVYRGASADDLALIGTTTSLSFVDSGAQGGGTHHYAARAVNAAGEGAWSNVFVATTLHAPAVPRALAGPGSGG